MSFTGRVRNYGRLHGAIGAAFTVFLVLLVIGFGWGVIDAAGHAGEYGFSWWDVIAQAGVGAVLIAICAAFVIGCVWYSITTDKQCDEWDATTLDLDNRYYVDENGSQIDGTLIHYDYQQDAVWMEWFDLATGDYHKHIVRKLTRAELQENKVLTQWGGTGGIKYHE